ncbi:response regulator [Myxococcus sp. RHSTA-1-4]|uniref:response regulator n=1 Tax=Myxococcus sp. RHSTA-1-4 TaxID=2874601 RepID=UPI001CBC8370|nr:response regulator [Myxococcus sp. RHSTA-1-4]MBZ4420605.1 response regulator [Myxococcus sp. RHSTA-1-4]
MARILIVDDEVHVLGALRRLLRREGFAIEVALSGEEALEKLRTFEADLVISDFRMRGMNGLQLLGQVMHAAPRTVRVLLSGHADLRTGGCPSAEGVVSHFFSKPWDNEHLIATVRSLLESHVPVPGSA